MRFLAPAVAAAVAGAALAIAPPAAAEGVYIENDGMYVGSDGALHILGEVRNGLDVPLRRIEVSASLHSGSGSPLGGATAGSPVNSIVPGMRAPFEVVAAGAEGVEGYALDLGYEVDGPKGRAIGVASSKMAEDGFGNLIITGSVVNNGGSTANAISVVATLYGRDGNVAAVSSAHAEPDYLRASEEAFFLVAVPGGARLPSGPVASYAVVAESEEYAAVPEFPPGAGALLAAAVAGHVLMARRWGRAAAPPPAA